MNTQLKTFHFNGLTELRGLAAIAVVVAHINQFHYLFEYEQFGLQLTDIGSDAVTFFFVLSGFLITYLLQNEKKCSGTINVKNFYMRRILRIWPVYFMSLTISLLLIYYGVIDSPENLALSILLYILLLANLAYTVGIAIRAITPLWSVGVEEQFYLIWPLIFKRVKNTSLSLGLITCAYILLKVTLWCIDRNGGEYTIVQLTRIDCMSIGGLLALRIAQGKKMNHFYNKYLLASAIILVCALTFLKTPFFANLETELKAIAFGIIIINVAANPNSFIKAKSRILNFFGHISYGMYCYHMIVFFVLSYIANKGWLNLISDQAIVMGVLIIVLTTLVSYLSYILMEKPLLSLKKKFESLSAA